jgi:hypothetical protein
MQAGVGDVCHQRTDVARTRIRGIANLECLFELRHDRRLVRRALPEGIGPLNGSRCRASSVIVVAVREVTDDLPERTHRRRWLVRVLGRGYEIR